MRTIGTIIALMLVLALGFWIFDRSEEDLVRDGTYNATTTESGIGGPDDGFDVLDDDNQDNFDAVEGKG